MWYGVAALVVGIIALGIALGTSLGRRGDREDELHYRAELLESLEAVRSQLAAATEQAGTATELAATATAIAESSHDRADDAMAEVSASRTELSASRTRQALSPQEQLELQASWSTLVCPYCGTAHWGLCPRVAKQTVHVRPSEQTTTTEFWPNDQWEPPAYSFTVDDVWGGPVPARPPQGDQNGPAAEPQGGTEQS